MTTFREAIGNDFEGIVKGEFSEAVELTPAAGGSPLSLKGIFDSTFRAVDPATQATIMSMKPRVTIWGADVPDGVQQGDRITARGKSYRVIEMQDDGEGSVTLYLD